MFKKILSKVFIAFFCVFFSLNFCTCVFVETLFSRLGINITSPEVTTEDDPVIDDSPTQIDMTPVSAKGLNISGIDASNYMVRPASGANFSITTRCQSDIWYLYSSSLSYDDCTDLRLQGYNASLSIPTATYPTINANYRANIKNTQNSIIDPVQEVGPQRVSAKLPKVYSTSIPTESERLSNRRTKGIKDGEDLPFPASTADDYEGREILMYDVTRDKYVPSICVYKSPSPIKIANGQTRTLVIYVEEGLGYSSNLPNYENGDYNLFANLFLKDNDEGDESGVCDNDIFDKMTACFGTDWGYFTHTQDSDLIAKDDTITLFYANIDNKGDPDGSYIGGYYYSVNNYLEGHARDRNGNILHSNERAMITLHAYASGGDFLGEALTTISHEFQHLIHAQHISGIAGRPYESSSAMDECFSSLAESLTADYIAEVTGKVVPGPFWVGAKARSKNRIERNTLGYLPNTEDYYYSLTNNASRAPSFLTGMNLLGFLDWDDRRSDDVIMCNYGLVASFAHWFLVNYGVQGVRAYLNGSNADLKGLAKAANKQYTLANTNPATMIADWGTAVLLSDIPNLKSPYSINREGWYNICGLNVPSIDYYYHYNGQRGKGIISLNKEQSNSVPELGGNVALKICENLPTGYTYSAKAPDLPYGMILTVVAVPHQDSFIATLQ